MQIDFRRYEKGDEKDILSVFERSFSKKMSSSYWKWRYINNPNSDVDLISLAWEDRKLAAHYALSPVQLYINGSKYRAALSMTTMTDPDYRGRGLFVKLAEELYLSNNKSLDVIFGVPNENSLNGFTRKLGFNLIKEIPMLESKISNEKYSLSDNCVLIDKFDDKFDELNSSVINRYKIITSRDSNYLNWRFVENPENSYKILAYLREEKVLGYAVIKVYSTDSSLIGDIVDLIALDEEVLRELVTSVFSIFRTSSVTSINTWFSDNMLMKVLEEFNFKRSEKYFHFIVRDNSVLQTEDLMNFKSWYLTMSDIDLF